MLFLFAFLISKTSEFPINVLENQLQFGNTKTFLDMVQKVKFTSEKLSLVQSKTFWPCHNEIYYQNIDWDSRSFGHLDPCDIHFGICHKFSCHTYKHHDLLFPYIFTGFFSDFFLVLDLIQKFA